MKLSRQLGLILAAHLVLLALLLAGCGYPERKGPPLYTYDSAALVQESARLHARDVGGYVGGPITCCGSMLPLIQNGDYLVIAPTPFADSLLGKVGAYAPAWNKGALVAHRFVSGDAKGGFIASGDNNPRSESFEPVTPATYRGEVVGIYRVKR
jgi:hypothetical protein